MSILLMKYCAFHCILQGIYPVLEEEISFFFRESLLYILFNK